MTVILNEDWSAYAENTKVNTITGWGVYGEFQAIQDAPQVNGNSQIKVVTHSDGVAYYNTGSTSHSSETEVVSLFQSTWVYAGVAVGVSSRSNYFTVRLESGTSAAIVYKNGGSLQALISHTVNLVIGDLLKLELDDDAKTIEMFVNGVSVAAATDITGLYTPTNQSGFFCRASDPLIGAITLGTLAELPIALNPEEDRKVYAVTGATYPYTVSGTYSENPTSIRVKVTEFVSGNTVIDWATLDATPTGGTFSGVVNMPVGPYYKITVDFSNDPLAMTSTERVGFGLYGEFAGQSNTDNIMGGVAVAATDNIAIFDGSTYQVPTNGEFIHALNTISAANNNCVIAAYNTAVPATGISYHLPGGANYAARQALLTSAGGKLSFLWWGQGESDTNNVATYGSSLGQLYADILVRTGQATETLPMYIVQLGRNNGGTGNDAGWQGIRNAQTSYADLTANVYISHQTIDLPMDDAFHRSTSGLVQEALRFADTFNSVYIGSGRSGRGAIPISANLSGSNVVINHDFNGGSLITIPASALDGYEVTEDDFTSLLTIDSISASSNKITLSLSAVPTGQVKVRSQQGEDPTVSKMPVSNVTYNSQPVIVEPINAPISATLALSVLNMTSTGTPDGTYNMVAWDLSNDSVFFNGDVIFSGGAASITTPLSVGSYALAFTPGNNPPITGIAYDGVTE